MHAGIEHVGVLSQYRPSALVRHIGTGEHWDFVGRTRGIRILPPYRGFKASDWYKGNADAVYQNSAYIEEFNPPFVLIASADHIYRMDYKPFIQHHIDTDADVTVCFTRTRKRSSRFGYGIIDRTGRLKKYVEKPETPPSAWASMTLYLFKTDVLIDALENNAHETSHEFGRDILPALLSRYRIQAYRFSDYWAYARTIDSYYATNMDVLLGKVNLNAWQVRTNLVERCTHCERMPASINGTVVNSVVSDGCSIHGTVRNSILSPGVVVATGAHVIDSIIYHDTYVGRNVHLRKTICDKDTTIGDNCTIGMSGDEIPSREYPELLHSGITLIGNKCTIPPGTTIGANTAIYAAVDIGMRTIEPGSTLR
jgi:glucose-1-phosphate adenylyltransferase